MSISVAFIIKNGISQGYCFWESLQSCLPFADEIIISEGHSQDDTYKYIELFVNKYKSLVPITLYREYWPEKSYVGEAIAKVTTNAIKKAKCDWIYYLQSDEVIHENTAKYIKNISSESYNSISFPFYHFIRAWSPCINPSYQEAVRMMRRACNPKLKGDAFTFLPVEPICPSGLCPKPIYHFAWVFPKANDVKDIEHYKLYENIPEYREKMIKACQNMGATKMPYPIDSSFNDFPELSKRFIGKAEYILPEKI